jgi:predicted NUDIX family NTP pyrophosphohydrolase
MFRRRNNELEVLLAHPGGPSSAQGRGAWTIPKARRLGRRFTDAAQIEFEEETLAFKTSGEWIELGSIIQKGGKTVHAWAFAGDLPDSFKLKSNTFEMEWPPQSGKQQKFSEIDQAAFFSEEVARRKINFAQVILLDRLRAALDDNQQRYPVGHHLA